jgi:hypothetical protein
MLVMYSPPIVHKYVEQREEDNEETSGPLGFEADRYHDASRKANQGEDYTGKIPFSLKGYSNEQEDQEHSTSQLEAGKDCWTGLNRTIKRDSLFLSVVITQIW